MYTSLTSFISSSPFLLAGQRSYTWTCTQTSTYRQVEPDAKAKIFVTQRNLYLYCRLHPIFYIYRRNQDNYSTTFTSSLTQARTPCWVVVLGLLHSSKRTRHLHCVISPWWQLKHSAKMYVGKLFYKLKLVPITSSSSNCFLYSDVQLFSLQFHCGST